MNGPVPGMVGFMLGVVIVMYVVMLVSFVHVTNEFNHTQSMIAHLCAAVPVHGKPACTK